MKKCGIVPVAVCGMAFCASAFSCPMFVEFFPDPKTVSDQEGEFVEIRLDDFRSDSLYVRFESKEILAFAWPKAERFVLVHDVSQCPSHKDVMCGLLGKISLPNSRESIWKVWAGSCMDSVTVPQPKPGKAVQRIGLTDEWAFVTETLGYGNPEYELGIEEDPFLESIAKLAKSLQITEIHHCPEEPMPEWVELYNASQSPIPLDAFRFCDRGGALGKVGDSIRPYQTILVSKDTSALRLALGIPDIRLIQVALGYLNNSEGSLSLCFHNGVADSVSWSKATVPCPSGFNPRTRKRESTPGYQPQSGQGIDAGAVREVQSGPVVYKLSSRVVSKKGSPLRVRVESEFNVNLSLLDSAGRRMWNVLVPANANEWVKVPVQENLGIGVGYVTLSVGDFEDVVGILVRP